MKAVLAALTTLLIAVAAQAQTAPGAHRILLIPVDDRPAVSHFAGMIGDIAGYDVITPPKEILGKFKQPGSPTDILAWLAKQDLGTFDAVIVSADMVAYGGLIASRTDRTSETLAKSRLRELWKIRKGSHETPFYVFSTLTRIAPTAIAENRAWRQDLYYWATYREQYRLYNDPEAKRKMDVYASRVPQLERERYDAVRARNVAIQTELIKMTYHGAFNQLTFGQDDAAPVGPHTREIAALNKEIDRLKLRGQTQFCMGIDQISNCLVSRAISDRDHWSPTVAIRTADTKGLDQIAAYESEPIRESLKNQIETSGATITDNPEKADYVLYLNTPKRDGIQFDAFVKEMSASIDAGKRIAVADTNLGWSGTADPELFDSITARRQGPQLVSYAGWNTAGNTMGTTIPAANAYLLALRSKVDGLRRETAARKFVLHRLVTDYFYNRYVRPEAYRMIEQMQNGNREEILSAENEAKVEAFVKQDMADRLQKTFNEQMVANPFKADGHTYAVIGLEKVVVELPWPRAYEVHIDFNLVVREVSP